MKWLPGSLSKVVKLFKARERTSYPLTAPGYWLFYDLNSSSAAFSASLMISFEAF